MDAILWLLAVILAFAFAYIMQFTGATLSMGRELFLGREWTDFDADFTAATLSMGRELSGTPSPTGFQDAITPPWLTKLTLVVYFGCALVIGFMWWYLGWQSSLGGAAVIFFGGGIAKLLLPKPTGAHYKHLIISSMSSRYADYVRDSDNIRAEAMKHLLAKAGTDVDALFDGIREPSQFPKRSRK